MRLLAAQTSVGSKLDRDLLRAAIYADNASKPPVAEANEILARAPLQKEQKERNRRNSVHQ